MPAIVANAKNFLIHSDYPLDKIILLWSGYTDFSTDFLFNHGLPFTPLVKIVWSLDTSFTTVYGVGDGPISGVSSTPFIPQLIRAYATSSAVYSTFGTPGATPGAYIRVYGFMPSDVNVDASFTANAADSFTISTDYNYTKLFLAGVTGFSGVAGSSEIVLHNLGYYPQVEVWYEKGTDIYAAGEIDLFDGALNTESFELSTTALVMRRDPFLAGTERFHYRIYADEL